MFAVETKVGDVHTEHMSTGTGKNPQVSGKYSLHSTNNHNVYVTLKELKKKFDKKIHVVKAGGTLMAGTTPVIKTSKSLLNHFGNFLLFYLTLHTLVGGGGCCKEEKARHTNKTGATKIHACLWNKYQPKGTLVWTGDSRKKIVKIWLKALEPFLKHFVAALKELAHDSYLALVTRWETWKQNGGTVPGKTTTCICSFPVSDHFYFICIHVFFFVSKQSTKAFV